MLNLADMGRSERRAPTRSVCVAAVECGGRFWWEEFSMTCSTRGAMMDAMPIRLYGDAGRWRLLALRTIGGQAAGGEWGWCRRIISG